MEVLALLLILLSSAILFLSLQRLKQHKNLPPGPYPWPILGNLLQLRRNSHKVFAEMAQSYGSIFSLRLGSQLLVVASSSAAAYEILKTQDRKLSARFVSQSVRIPGYIESSFIFASDCNETWRSMRAICKTDLFSTKMLEAHAHLRQKTVSKMVEFLSSKVGEAVMIGELVFTTVFNIEGNLIFSKDVLSPNEDGRDDGLKKHMSRVLEMFMVPNLADFFPILSNFDIQGLKQQGIIYNKRIYALWDSFIQERKEKGRTVDSRHDFLKILLSNGFSDNQIKALLLDMFTAGTDTVTCSIEWTLAELVRNPEAMRLLKEELIREVGKRRGAVEEFHLPHLAYLHACIKESLRLHPPVPLLLPHRALETCQVMDYTIPEGCTIMINAWAIHRDPGNWTNPLIFRPERFLESDLNYKGSNFAYLPFGSGRRMCPGLSLGICIIQLVIASLVHNFDWSLPHGLQPYELNMNENFSLVLEREQPLLLIPKVTAL